MLSLKNESTSLGRTEPFPCVTASATTPSFLLRRTPWADGRNAYPAVAKMLAADQWLGVACDALSTQNLPPRTAKNAPN